MMYNVIIVEDQPLIRSSLKLLIEQQGNATVVAEASNGEEFLSLLVVHEPDLVLMDINMPVMDGIEATRKGLKKNPSLNVLALSAHGDESNYYKMVTAGVKGFILKGSDMDEVSAAVEAVAQGNSFFSAELLKTIATGVNDSPAIKMTDQEKNIISYICEGLDDKQIKDTMKLTDKSLEKLREGLLQKTGCTNPASLIMYAIKHKMIEI